MKKLIQNLAIVWFVKTILTSFCWYIIIKQKRHTWLSTYFEGRRFLTTILFIKLFHFYITSISLFIFGKIVLLFYYLNFFLIVGKKDVVLSNQRTSSFLFFSDNIKIHSMILIFIFSYTVHINPLKSCEKQF